jgi:hypothetical protein
MASPKRATRSLCAFIALVLLAVACGESDPTGSGSPFTGTFTSTRQ